MIKFKIGKDLELCQSDLAYNLMVIKALWKSKWSNYGENGIKGHEYDFNSLYRSIEKGKETMRLYIQCEYRYKENLMINWADRIEAKTGIPHEYLTGAERIILGSEYEKKYYPIYTNFLQRKSNINKQLENADNNPVSGSAEEIKQYAKETCSPEELAEFSKNIKVGEEAAALLAWFNQRLAREADRIMKIDTAELMQQNMKLCKLVYFITFKKKYDGISIRTIDDMKLMIERTRAFQLKELGKKGLKEYIEKLEAHLNLARSVYTVAIDCGDFAPDKGDKAK